MFRVTKFAFWSVVTFADVKHGIVYYGSTDYLYMMQQSSVCLSAITYLLLFLMASKIYPAKNTPKDTIIEPINTVHGSYHNNSLGKDKGCIEIIRTNPKKTQKSNTANRPEEKNEEKQKKVQDREEKPETTSTKPSDSNADVTNRVYILDDSIVKHNRGYELSQRVENCKVKNLSGAKVRYMGDYIQPTLRE